MQNQLFRIKQFTPYATQACVLRLKTLPTPPKHFEYDQIKTKIFGLKDEGYEAIETRKSMNHKLPSFRCSLKIQRYLSCVIFTQRFLLFSTDFSIFDRNVNLSKINPEAENFFLAFPLAKIPRFLRRI
jgi:hypothetical protein